jgi:excinuclease ABC subunit C
MQKIDIKEIPTSPGIYIFKDEYEEPLYVGKAKNLRKRVPSYFREKSSWKIKRLVAESKDLSFVVSKNEADALLAEYSFIQEYKPKYNVQFKDDKSYPYVTLSNEEWPRAYISRRISQRNKNFGPFPFIGSARRSLDHLINIGLNFLHHEYQHFFLKKNDLHSICKEILHRRLQMQPMF